MSTSEIIRLDVNRQLDEMMPDMLAGRFSTVEFIVRPYRKPGEQVSVVAKRDPQQQRDVAKA